MAPVMLRQHAMMLAAACLTRRLLHFEVVDAAGELQPLDRMELIKEPLKLTGGLVDTTCDATVGHVSLCGSRQCWCGGLFSGCLHLEQAGLQPSAWDSRRLTAAQSNSLSAHQAVCRWLSCCRRGVPCCWRPGQGQGPHAGDALWPGHCMDHHVQCLRGHFCCQHSAGQLRGGSRAMAGVQSIQCGQHLAALCDVAICSWPSLTGCT